MPHASPWDPETHYKIERSETPVSVDGYKLDEPKRLVCDECGAGVLITPEPTPGIDYLRHTSDCPQFEARSDWFWEHFGRGGD